MAGFANTSLQDQTRYNPRSSTYQKRHTTIPTKATTAPKTSFAESLDRRSQRRTKPPNTLDHPPQPLQELFAPDLESSFRWLSLLAMVGTAGAIIAVLSYSKRRFRLRPVGQMMGPLLALVGLGGAAFIISDVLAMPSVAVYDTFAVIQADTIPASQFRKAYLEPVSVNSYLGQSVVKDLAIVEFADGRQQIFGADEYDTRRLVEALRKMMGQQPE